MTNIDFTSEGFQTELLLTIINYLEFFRFCVILVFAWCAFKFGMWIIGSYRNPHRSRKR